MNLIEANAITYRLIAQHLPGMGWRVNWDNARSRNGQCRYATKTLSFSRPLTRIATEEEFTNTVLHEIAHALTPGHRHGNVWRAKFIALGGNGERCSSRDPEGVIALAKWTILCVSCDFKTHRNRLTQSIRTGGRCPQCHSSLNFKENR
jgi:predicted SprT family Zn-dependent metalloprotease